MSLFINLSVYAGSNYVFHNMMTSLLNIFGTLKRVSRHKSLPYGKQIEFFVLYTTQIRAMHYSTCLCNFEFYVSNASHNFSLLIFSLTPIFFELLENGYIFMNGVSEVIKFSD